MTTGERNVPPPLLDVLPSQRRGTGAGDTAPRTFRALVLDATPSSTGAVRVLIDGTATRARLRNTAKAVQAGDNVEVVKLGGMWHVAGSDTYHQPPEVPDPPTTTPRQASTVTTTSLRSPGGRPGTPSYPTSNSNAALFTWANRVTTLLASGHFNWQGSINNSVEDLRSAVTSMRSALNANASGLNQAAEVATGTRDSVRSEQGALRQDGIIR